jgi:hypothetical protein
MRAADIADARKSNGHLPSRDNRMGVGVTAASLNIAGLLMNLAGVVLLFRYGAPFRVRADGSQVRWLTGVKNQQIVRAERVKNILGWIGLTLILLGTASQIWGTLIGV